MGGREGGRDGEGCGLFDRYMLHMGDPIRTTYYMLLFYE